MTGSLLKRFFVTAVLSALVASSFSAADARSHARVKAHDKPAAAQSAPQPEPSVLPPPQPRPDASGPASAGTPPQSASQSGVRNPVAVPATAPAVPAEPHKVAFDAGAGVMELRDTLSAYHPAGNAGAEKGVWYIFAATNASARPVFRVLQAGQVPGGGFGLLPHSARPAVLQVSSNNPAVSIENTRGYGKRAYRIGIPAQSSAVLAVRIEGASEPPSLLSWTEPALAAHNRWMAIFVATVAGLIAAAAAIAAGLTFMSHQSAPRWAAMTLFTLLMMRLADIGLFDGSLITPVGGPYGLITLFSGLSLAAGLKLIDTLLPFRAIWPRRDRQFVWLLRALVCIAVLAYLGVPFMSALVDLVSLFLSIAVSAYVVYWWRKGSHSARALAPSTIMFTLFVLMAFFAAFGGFGANPLSPDIAGGFLATGSVLLILALVAGEGVGLMAFARHMSGGTAAMGIPVPHAALEAIGASFQGVFEIDLKNDAVVLSREAATLLGLSRRVHNWHTGVWLARLHPEDRPVYEQAIVEFAREADYAFRIEFRARDEEGRYLWFELRATTKGQSGAASGGAVERIVGLIADVTMRKEAEAAAVDRTLRDTLTGLGNRVAMMEALDALAPRLKSVRYAQIDIDGFKALRAAEGDGACDEVIARLGERLIKRYGETAQLFRIGGDVFAVLCEARGAPLTLGNELIDMCAEGYRIDGRMIHAPVSVGIAEGRSARDPLNLINQASVALRLARFQGGACAQIYAQGMERMAPADAGAFEEELRTAIEAGEIEIAYQPLIRLADRSVAGFEARARWRHATKGLIAPCELIAHSEDDALIAALGRFVLKETAAKLAEWQRYFPLSEPLFAVVVPLRRQWADSSLSGYLSALLRESEVAHGSLVLAAAEETLAAHPAERFAHVRQTGVALAALCYNTGKAALAGLDNVPLDMVRIDRSYLIRHAGEETAADKRLTELMATAGAKKLRILADGVESEDDAARLADMGCHIAEGFLFAEPLSAEDALKCIAEKFRPADSEGAE